MLKDENNLDLLVTVLLHAIIIIITIIITIIIIIVIIITVSSSAISILLSSLKLLEHFLETTTLVGARAILLNFSPPEQKENYR